MRAIEELRRMMEEATPGPWVAEDWMVFGELGEGWVETIGLVGGGENVTAGDRANASLIAAAVNSLPALLDVAEAARELARWDWLGHLDDHPDSDTVREDVARLQAALAALEGE